LKAYTVELILAHGCTDAIITERNSD